MNMDNCKSIRALVEIQENGLIRLDNIVIGHLTDNAKEDFENIYSDMVVKSMKLAMNKVQMNSKYGATSTTNTDFRDDPNREGQDSYFGGRDK